MFVCLFVVNLQVDQNRAKLLNDRAVAKSQLQKKLGQLLYLTNLEKVSPGRQTRTTTSNHVQHVAVTSINIAMLHGPLL